MPELLSDPLFVTIAVIAVIADARLGRALPMATNSPPSVPCGDPTADRSPLPDVVTRIGEGGKVGNVAAGKAHL